MMVGVKNRYLPDFFLPRTKTWVEVKGSLGKSEARKMGDMLDWGCPMDGIDESFGHDDARGLLLLGDIPKNLNDLILHPIITHHKGLHRQYIFFAPFSGPQKISMKGNDDILFGMITGGLSNISDSIDPMTYSDNELNDFFSARHIPIKSIYIFNDVAKGYRAASSARFEFGEKGAC